MTIVREHISIRGTQSRVFTAYVAHIDKWWPRMGTYRYSYAPASTEPKQIQFEQKINGRFYETFADGSEYVIGHIIEWNPPHQLSYTWRDPQWPSHTTVTVTFAENEGETVVTVTHVGFGENGVPTIAEGYEIGLREIMMGFQTWTEANQ
jgi:uncharacterized protein YndB with AHSA1/START domain